VSETSPQTDTDVKQGSSKIGIIIVAVLMAAFVGFILFQPQAISLSEGMPAPDFTLTDNNGKTWKLSSLEGSVVVINFWASWCPPCKEEMPFLHNLYRQTSDVPNFVILPILYKDDMQKAMAYLNGEGFADLPVLSDPDMSAAKAFGVTGVPETYIIDKKGILRNKIIGGFKFDSSDAINIYKTLLSEE
jgi:peroxiredoxin